MLDSEMTIISTGWRVRTNKRRNSNSSGYSSDDYVDGSDSLSTTSSDSSGSKSRSMSPPKGPKMIQIIDTASGERKMICEAKFQKDMKRESKKQHQQNQQKKP